jgi:hypothetical protein
MENIIITTIYGEHYYHHYLWRTLLSLLFMENIIITTIYGEHYYHYYLWRTLLSLLFMENIIITTIYGEHYYHYYLWRTLFSLLFMEYTFSEIICFNHLTNKFVKTRTKQAKSYLRNIQAIKFSATYFIVHNNK